MKQYKIPPSVKRQALISVKLKELGFDGGLETGINRGYQLAYDDYISEKDAKVMKAWFARHLYTSRPGYEKWVNNGKPMDPKYKHQYRGAVAWLLWGGDPAYKWINKLNLI
jgi:hypothetical protein